MQYVPSAPLVSRVLNLAMFYGENIHEAAEALTQLTPDDERHFLVPEEREPAEEREAVTA